MTQLNEVWPQGAEPGDPPISSVAVPVDPVMARRQEARDRCIEFAKEPPPKNSAARRVHDLLVALGFDE